MRGPTPITVECVDFYGQYVQLAMQLPPGHDEPRPLRCRKCGHFLGCVANGRGIALGHFTRKDNQWSQLIGSSIISERKVRLKCGKCRTVTEWRTAAKKE
ncbi:MAG: hypothetical protein ACYTG0_30290 [Planctomycetota bacterium]|jgi:ribosomal protein S27AE